MLGERVPAPRPRARPGSAGGAEVPGDHQVDNRSLVHALLSACERSGVELVREAVSAVRIGSDGSVSGVLMTRGGSLDSAAVVISAGSETPRLGGVPDGVLPPIRPVKGHILRLRGTPTRPLIERTVRGLVKGRSCYLVPRSNGTLVVGSTVEERGYDRSVQAGPVRDLLEDARTLVPGVEELELVECGVGLRPGSPDNSPFVGWSAVPGLAVASGHHRNGILLAPLTADAIVSVLRGTEVPEALRPFGVGRVSAADLGSARLDTARPGAARPDTAPRSAGAAP